MAWEPAHQLWRAVQEPSRTGPCVQQPAQTAKGNRGSHCLPVPRTASVTDSFPNSGPCFRPSTARGRKRGLTNSPGGSLPASSLQQGHPQPSHCSVCPSLCKTAVRAADSLARASPVHTIPASSHQGLLFTCSQQGQEGDCLQVQPCGPSSKMTRVGPSSLQFFLEPQSSGTWASNSLLHLSRHRHPTVLAHTPTGPGLDPVSGHVSPLAKLHSRWPSPAPCILAPLPVSLHWGGLSLRPAGPPPITPTERPHQGPGQDCSWGLLWPNSMNHCSFFTPPTTASLSPSGRQDPVLPGRHRAPHTTLQPSLCSDHLTEEDKDGL